VSLGEQHGYRNAQATVLAPTGTIGLLMDCDTTGIEPDFALVKFKKLAGGGYFKIVNQSVPRALEALGYSAAQIAEIVAYVVGTNTLARRPARQPRVPQGQGLRRRRHHAASRPPPGRLRPRVAFAPHVLGEDLVKRLGVEEAAKTPGFSLLRHWASAPRRSRGQRPRLGRMTVEGAPHLRDEHYSVFDCANRCGKHGRATSRRCRT
jgi:ribonucleoside-diphosphate reductase alpha chain